VHVARPSLDRPAAYRCLTDAAARPIWRGHDDVYRS
jgi:hypothetical protein